MGSTNNPMLVGFRTNDPKMPVTLDANGLLHHTLIVGQSGSGKSFFVARLIEEIILNTRCRVLVVDPNGDFRAISTVSPAVWTTLGDNLTTISEAGNRFQNFDDEEIFTAIWRTRRFLHLHPNVGSLPKSSDMVLHRRLLLHWDRLDPEDRDFLLRCSGQLSPRIMLGLEACSAAAQFFSERPEASFGDDLRGLVNAAEQFAAKNLSLRPFPYAKDLVPEDWYGVRATVMELLRQYTIWWSKTVQGSFRPRGLDAYLDGPFWGAPPESEDVWDVMTFGLDVSRASDALLVVNTALSRLWQNAKSAWRRAARSAAAEEGGRVPTFVVIDEAQRFAPATPIDPLRRRVTEQLIQIAAEGRKYGIYLILATQRPTKLHPELVPECENSCVLRVQSSVDADFASSILGISKNLVANAPSFRQGQGLIAGRWISNDIAIDTRFGPARTVVGGGGIPDTWKARMEPSVSYAREYSQIHRVVLTELEQSESAVTLVELAEIVRTNCPNLDDGSWGEHGTFKALISSLRISGLEISTVPPGYAFLKGRHSAPASSTPAFVLSDKLQTTRPELAAALQELHQQTGLPLLKASGYAAVLEALSDEVQEPPFQLSLVSRNIRDRLAERGEPVGRGAIQFIIKGVSWAGHRYDPDLPQDPKTMATAFVRLLRQMVDPRPPLEGDVLNEALSHCTGGLLSPSDVSRLVSDTILSEPQGPPVVVEDDGPA